MRGDHGRDVRRPGGRAAGKAGRRLGGLEEAGADRERMAGLRGLGAGGGVLVPVGRLIGAGAVAGEDLEDDVEGMRRIGLGPARRHRAAVRPAAVDEDDRFATDPEIGRIGRVVRRDVGQVALDLRDRGIARAFPLVVEAPPEGRPGRSCEEGRDPRVGLAPLAPPGGNACLDVAVPHGRDLVGDHGWRRRIVEPEAGVVLGVGIGRELGPGLGKPGVEEGGADRQRRLEGRGGGHRGRGGGHRGRGGGHRARAEGQRLTGDGQAEDQPKEDADSNSDDHWLSTPPRSDIPCRDENPRPSSTAPAAATVP